MATVLIALVILCYLESMSGLTVVRIHTCNFEPPGGSCGWSLPPPRSGGFSRITQAQNPPPLGPREDTNPGNTNGHYVYYYTNQSLSVPDQVLLFPSHQFLCGLSFSYFVSGPMDLEVVRENAGVNTVYFSQEATNSSLGSNPWESVSYSYNTTLEFTSSGSSLYFEASQFELGEAPLEFANQELFLALDNVTLTFCLPCDYDSLVEPGAIIIGGPQRIDLELRRLTSYQFNASTPACPNETLVFNIESVVPEYLTPIFTLNSASGQLLVDASGPNLDANGTSGFLNVSVHVSKSNYTQVSHPHRQIVIVPFTQPPTINHTAPQRIPVDVTTDFLYQFTTSSILGLQLSFSRITAIPPQLASDTDITIFQHQTGVRIMGRVSILETLPLIIQQMVTPSLSVAISDAHGGVVIVTTQLQINPSPPLFDRPHYTFDLAENTSRGVFLGPIRLIDPNGGPITAPTITPNIQGGSLIFSVVDTHFSRVSESDPDSTAFSSYSLLVNSELNYEQVQMLDFQLVVVDDQDSSLVSTATVSIRILPVNEFTPVFILPSLEAYVAENQPRRSLVATLEASDRDTGPDGIVDYAITGGNSDGYFTISGMGFGEVVVKRTPINPHVYSLTITASDRGVPPRSATASLTVHVVATSEVNCTTANYAPPQVSSSSPPIQELPVNANLTLACSYSANPTVRGYKWTHNGHTLLVGDTDPHYTVTNNSLSINSLNSSDGGLFLCNVTNQCGFGVYPFLIRLIDYPNPPRDVRIVDRPSLRSLVLVWELPTGATLPVTEFYNTPVTGYTVEVWDRGVGVGYQDWLSIPSPSTTSATVTGLHPGVQYSVRVLALNQAGAMPSAPVEITTNASVPSIDHLRATALLNNSILVEWGLEFNGGHPISLFEVHVMLHLPRARSRRATPTSADLVYHVDASARRLVTRTVDAGHTYTISALATNILGPSNNQLEDVFVGYTDISSCDFEPTGRGDCVWSLNRGVATRADDVTPPLPATDASGNSQGHYVYAQVSSISESETVLMSYSRAGYSCGLTFSYYVTEGGTLLLRTSSGSVLWSSPPLGASPAWEVVGLTDSRYLTSVVQEGLEFVLTTTESGSVALDDVSVNFCLPCNFNALDSRSSFELSYDNYSRVYLRTPHTMEIQSVIQDCPNAILNFSISRIIPTAIRSSFALSSQDGRSLTLSVEPISPSRVEPNSLGYLEVMASVVNSDYQFPDHIISRVAIIEIFLAEVVENCTFTRMCQFEGEGECDRWRIGDNVRLVNARETPVQNSFTGSCLFASVSSNTEVTMATSVINEDICGVSFAYAVSPPPTELVVMVDGLRSIWSTLTAPMVSGWAGQTLQVDLQDVQIMENRSMSYVARFGGSGTQYAVLDNITLHPCTDCATPVCTLTSCIPGHYYSLDHGSCMDCPPGYYCPDWRIFPKPCPAGTFSSSANAFSLETCQDCLVGSFAVESGSVACHSCPAGFDCSNASGIPLATGNSGCPATSPMSTMEEATPATEKFTATIVGLGLALGLLLLILCLSITCAALWCWKRKQQRYKKKNDRRFLLASKSNDNLGLNLSMVKSGKQMMNPGGNSVRTMTSLLSDNDSLNCFEDSSWMETEELTKPRDCAGGQKLVLHNVNFNDNASDQEQHEMQGAQLTGKKTAAQTNF